MRVLADYHHADLFESYQLTLVDRFGWTVMRPIGMDWFDQGYWAFEKAVHGDAVARQYLTIWDTDEQIMPGRWVREDATHPGRLLQMIELEAARAYGFDAVISSVKHNDPGLARFARETGATFGVQVGNVGQVLEVDWDPVGFALLSTTSPIPIRVPHVIYHQEFSLVDFRPSWPPAGRTTVASFVQHFPEAAGSAFYSEFLGYARTLPELDWRAYGRYGDYPLDEFACGNLETTPAVAQAMRDAAIGWHAKVWSDGFGHVIHNLFAVGRPVFGYGEGYYADKLAGPLFIDGVTSYDLGRHAPDEIIRELRRLATDDEYHRAYCEAAARRFREIVDYRIEAEAIRALLERAVG